MLKAKCLVCRGEDEAGSGRKHVENQSRKLNPELAVAFWRMTNHSNVLTAVSQRSGASKPSRRLLRWSSIDYVFAHRQRLCSRNRTGRRLPNLSALLTENHV